MPRPVTIKRPDLHIVVLQRTCNSIACDSSFGTERQAKLVSLLTTAIEELGQEQLLRVKEKNEQNPSEEKPQDSEDVQKVS